VRGSQWNGKLIVIGIAEASDRTAIVEDMAGQVAAPNPMLMKQTDEKPSPTGKRTIARQVPQILYFHLAAAVVIVRETEILIDNTATVVMNL